MLLVRRPLGIVVVVGERLGQPQRQKCRMMAMTERIRDSPLALHMVHALETLDHLVDEPKHGGVSAVGVLAVRKEQDKGVALRASCVKLVKAIEIRLCATARIALSPLAWSALRGFRLGYAGRSAWLLEISAPPRSDPFPFPL